ncbi:MAG: hypothetical protein WC867_05050 [Candidatus Pacearchaeota archaeon]|jgi:hypothetical protein
MDSEKSLIYFNRGNLYYMNEDKQFIHIAENKKRIESMIFLNDRLLYTDSNKIADFLTEETIKQVPEYDHQWEKNSIDVLGNFNGNLLYNICNNHDDSTDDTQRPRRVTNEIYLNDEKISEIGVIINSIQAHDNKIYASGNFVNCYRSPRGSPEGFVMEVPSQEVLYKLDFGARGLTVHQNKLYGIVDINRNSEIAYTKDNKSTYYLVNVMNLTDNTIALKNIGRDSRVSFSFDDKLYIDSNQGVHEAIPEHKLVLNDYYSDPHCFCVVDRNYLEKIIEHTK